MTRRASAMRKGFVRHGAPLCSRNACVAGSSVSPVKKIGVGRGGAAGAPAAGRDSGRLARACACRTGCSHKCAPLAWSGPGTRSLLCPRYAHRGAATAPARWPDSAHHRPPGSCRRAPLRLVAQGGVSNAAGTAPTGSVRRNVAPWPGALVTSRVPPCASTIPRHNGSPSPVPTPGGLVVKKGSKMRAWSAGGIPGPVSVTRSVIWCCAGPYCVVR